MREESVGDFFLRRAHICFSRKLKINFLQISYKLVYLTRLELRVFTAQGA